MPEAAAPAQPVGYSAFYRTPRQRWWKSLLTVIIVPVSMLIAVLVFGIIAAFVDVALGSFTIEELTAGEMGMTPLTLLANNLGIIVGGAVGVLLHRTLHRQPIGQLHSVIGRFRWKWLGLSAVVIVPYFIVYVALFGGVFDPSISFSLGGTALAFLAVVILTTPLQAASEEYAFRGVVQRAAAGWFSGQRAGFLVGTLISSAVFCLMHFAADPYLISYYLVFGIAMAVLTQITGGLEAAVLIHVANNTLLFIVSTLAGQMDAGIDRSAGTGGPFMLIPMGVLALITVIVWVLGRRRVAVTGVPSER